MRITFLLQVGFAALLLALVGSACAADTKHPNIVYILADDLGYGDVRRLNPQGKIATPQLDRLAAAGMIFTDAHSSSAVCTPTRYGLLTGRYNWRSRLKSGVMGGMSPPLIEPGRLTVPAFLQQQGYHTACIGKWHLGFDWPRQPDTAPFTDGIEKGADGWRVDFSKPIARGPNAFGFDYFFGLAASLDMVPYSFIENDRVTKVPTVDKAFPMMFGRTHGATRKGPAAADFEAIDVLPTLTRRAVAYLNERASDAKSGRPFFLYVPLNAPHTPIAPSKEWQGKSGLNPYADFVMETDARVGEVLDALDRNGVAGNTLIIFTSDNGCSPEAKFPELLAQGHNPSAQFRGTKADIFEGGHRVPFLVRWPGRVKSSTTSDQLICLNDLFATCADIVGVKLPDNAAEDSVSLLPALEGRPTTPIREALVHHSINGSFALRQGKWKLELCADSGGWSDPRPGSPAAKSLPTPQLYDLSSDLAETNNVARAHPEIVTRLTALLENYVADGRSTPGTAQSNTTPVEIHRSPVSSAASATRWMGDGRSLEAAREKILAQVYVGALLKRWEESGERERTIVVVSGDHGMPGVPGGKCNLYDFGTGVALVAPRIAFPDLDASPTKACLVEHRANTNLHDYYDRAFAKRPAEELYDLRTDPNQTKNGADKASFLVEKNGLAKRLMKILTDTHDPRVTGDGLKFDRSPFTDAEAVVRRERPQK